MKKSIFIFWLVLFGFAATIGFAQSFPDGFQGTWKRAQYASTLTFTRNTVKASNRDVFWTLKSVAGNKYAIVSSSKGAALSLTVRLVSGKLEISGDSGKGEANWNGTYASVKPARKPTIYVNGKLEILNNSGSGESNGNDTYTNSPATVSFDSQGGSYVASQTVAKGSTVSRPEDPVKEGVFFGGWYTDTDYSNPCDYTAMVSGTLTLYAKWLTESEMFAAEFGASVPASNIFEVNNASAAAAGQPGWNNSWAKVRAAINAGGVGKNYVIKVTGNFQLAGVESSTFTPRTIKVLVYAPANKTISSSGGKGSLLNAGASQTLILRNITLQGSLMSNTNALMVMRSGTEVSGGVSVDGGTFTMSGGTISSNWIWSDSVLIKGGTFTMSGGTISGVSVSGGAFTMSGGAISGKYNGVSVSGGTFTMNSGAISGNTGGVRVGINFRSGTFTMNGGVISGNTTPGYGAGVSVDGGKFTMNDGTISGNTAIDPNYHTPGSGGAGGHGGGVSVINSGTFTMNGGTISGNTANGNTESSRHGGSGGGVYVSSDGTFTMSGGAISGNTVGRGGGGVYVGGDSYSGSGTFTMNGGAISGNAAGAGGGVRVDGGKFTMSDGAISGNKADDTGGGVRVDSGIFWLMSGTVHGKGAGIGLANTAPSGASLSIQDSASIAKYGSGGDLIESGLATDATLVGHD